MVKLQQAVVATLNELIDEMTDRANVPAGEVSAVTIAGNTTMIQLLLAIDPKYLRLAPTYPRPASSRRYRRIDWGSMCRSTSTLYTVPSVASYVGGDIVAGIVGSGIYQRPKRPLYRYRH